MKTTLLKVAAAACLILMLSACGDDDDNTNTGAGGEPHVIDMSNSSIVDIAVGSAPEFTTLVSALQTAGLVGTLSGPGPFTVFAPTNEAFSAIQSTVDTLNVNQLRAVLNYHVLPGIRPASDIPSTTGAPATVVGDPIRASNGTIFVIDQVLLP